MFRVTEVLQPQPGEQVERLVRRPVLTLLPWLLLSAILISLPFFIFYPLAGYGFWGVTALLVSLAAGVALAVRAFWLWDSNVFIATNRRLIEVKQTNPWSRLVTEEMLAKPGPLKSRWEKLHKVQLFHRAGDLMEQAGDKALKTVEKIVDHKA